MLTPEYLEQVGSDLSDLYYDLETEIIADIAERLKINGDRMTTTAEYLVMKLEQMGYQHEYIQRRLVSIMNISEQKVSQILDDSTYQSMRDSLQRAKTYESVDGSSISFDEQILQSKTAINAELKNLTNSTARMATNTMLRTFDDAYMKVSSGAYSLNQAVDQAIKELIDTGIGQVTYRSGTKRNIDTAVRVAVRTGVNQNALKCEEQLLEATEHNLVVVSAHMGARPSHAEWQGKIYWRDHPEGDYENFEEATGYGTGAGLGGWNCRHQFFAYYPEMGNPYEDVDTKNNREVYELTQQQRYNERMIRKWKRRKTVYAKAGLDTTLENQKIREWTERNNALIKSSKYLKRQYANEKSYAVQTRGSGLFAQEKERTYIRDDGIRNEGHVNLDLVNTRNYHKRFESISKHKSVNESLYRESMTILNDKNNTEFEDIVAIDSRTGKRLTKNTQASLHQKKHQCGFSPDEEKYLANREGEFEVLHNHPNSSFPSRDDIRKLFQRNKQTASTICCHNGDVYRLEKVKHYENIAPLEKELYNNLKEKYGVKQKVEYECSKQMIEKLSRAGYLKFIQR